MSDTVKFVFKTLIKVPVYIMISFLIFNVLVFGYSVLRLYGAYYLAVSTAVENNYIPPSEQTQLETYFSDMESDMLSNIRLTSSTYTGDSSRVQYGSDVTVGVEAEFNMIMPLQPKEYNGGDVQGLNATGTPATVLTEDQIKQKLEEKNNNGNGFTITFETVVPGLRYYADLD